MFLRKKGVINMISIKTTEDFSVEEMALILRRQLEPQNLIKLFMRIESLVDDESFTRKLTKELLCVLCTPSSLYVINDDKHYKIPDDIDYKINDKVKVKVGKFKEPLEGLIKGYYAKHTDSPGVLKGLVYLIEITSQEIPSKRYPFNIIAAPESDIIHKIVYVPLIDTDDTPNKNKRAFTLTETPSTYKPTE
jgi:hypothetical protein